MTKVLLFCATFLKELGKRGTPCVDRGKSANNTAIGRPQAMVIWCHTFFETSASPMINS